MNIFASDILFYVFGALAVVLSLMVVFMRNPVSSAMMMALSFGATAAIMIGLGAHFLGILQILVYAGAIMVLFTFIIMLLNVKRETSPFKRPCSVAVGVIIAALFLGQLIGIVYSLPGAKETHRCPMANAEQAWNDLSISRDEAAPGKPRINGLTPQEIRQQSCVLATGCRTSCGDITKSSLDRLLYYRPPSMVLPPISPQYYAVLYPENSTIHTELANGEFPDTALLGRTLFAKYNRTLVIAGLALLVASIGVVVLSRRPSGK